MLTEAYAIFLSIDTSLHPYQCRGEIRRGFPMSSTLFVLGIECLYRILPKYAHLKSLPVFSTHRIKVNINNVV